MLCTPRLALATILGPTLLSAPAATAADCSERLLQPDIVAGRSDLWFKAHVATTFTKEQFEVKNRDLVASGGGFAFGYGEAQAARNRVEESMKSSLEVAQSTSYFQMTGNAAGYAAYVACKTLDPNLAWLGLHVAGHPDDKDFHVTIVWKPSQGDPGPLTGVTATVTGGVLDSKPPESISAGSRTFTVKRASADRGIKISVDGTKRKAGYSHTAVIAPFVPIEPVIRFPIFVEHTMIGPCKTRGGDRCAWDGASVSLAGSVHTHGVIYTQTYDGNRTAVARFPVVKGAGKLVFTVGNYYQGSDCGGTRPMNAAVYIDGALKWNASVASVSSGSLDLSVSAKEIELRGESVDQDERCDDMAWGSVRFER